MSLHFVTLVFIFYLTIVSAVFAFRHFQLLVNSCSINFHSQCPSLQYSISIRLKHLALIQWFQVMVVFINSWIASSLLTSIRKFKTSQSHFAQFRASALTFEDLGIMPRKLKGYPVEFLIQYRKGGPNYGSTVSEKVSPRWD